MKLTLPSLSRVWTDLVFPEGKGVFIPSIETPAVGSPLDFSLEAPGLTAPLQLSATVDGLKALDGTHPAGVLVSLDVASIEKCRAAAGTEHSEQARTTGRQEVRVDCQLPARIDGPEAVDGCTVRNLSEGGLTLLTPGAPPEAAELEVSVQLTDGAAVRLPVQTVWRRPELKLLGLKVGELDEPTRLRLRRQIAELQAAPGPGALAQLVVLADDDPSILELMSRIVKKAGFRVERAARGDLGLELIRQHRPAMVFLDVLMPGLDGLEVCRAVRADAALARIPVVLVSAMGEQRLLDTVKAAGATSFLNKPIHLEAVRALLSKYLPAR